MTKQEMYRQLRSLGFSAEQALDEMDGSADDSYESATIHRAGRAVQPPSPADMAAYMATTEREQTLRQIAAGRKVAVAMPSSRRSVTRGPMFEYFAKPVRKGAKITVSAGNNTDVYKVLSKKALSVPAIAAATGIPAHSVESSVYQLRTAGLVDKRPIAR
jgi:hypothetical protein